MYPPSRELPFHTNPIRSSARPEAGEPTQDSASDRELQSSPFQLRSPLYGSRALPPGFRKQVRREADLSPCSRGPVLRSLRSGPVAEAENSRGRGKRSSSPAHLRSAAA